MSRSFSLLLKSTTRTKQIKFGVLRFQTANFSINTEQLFYLHWHATQLRLFLPLVCFYHSVECTVSFHAKIQVVHNSHKVIMFAMNQDLQTKYCKHIGDTTTVAMHHTLTASIRSSSPLLNDISSSAFLINTVPWNKPIIHCQKQKCVCTCNGMCVCVSAQSQLQRNSQTAHTESPPARHRGEGREREQWPIPKKLSLKIETVLNKNEIRNLSNKLIQVNPLFFQVEERKKTTTSK